MASYPSMLGLVLGGILIFGLLIYTLSGTIMSLLVILALAGIIYYVLTKFGYLKFDVGTNELDVSFNEVTPLPSVPQAVTTMPINQKEVFYISGNNYTYDDAPAVCGAYEAELATYDQIMEAYSQGAEWCGYGWSAGGMALYPTQDSTWKSLIQEVSSSKRTACGRPGVNGGYFDPKTKFGVNCYGVKPHDKGTNKYPRPLPGGDANYDTNVNKFRSMINKININPFNRSTWSEWTLAPQVKKN